MTRIPSDVTAASLPQPIARALRRLIRRIREVILVRGISAVIATAAASLLLIMAIDASTVLFSGLTRWLLTLSAFGLTIASAVGYLLLPLARTITLTGTARAIDERHPELQERISSAVELLTSRDVPEIRGSQVLIDALAAEASRDAAHVRPRAEVPLKSARPFLLAAIGALVVFAALLALYPSVRRLALRAAAPWINLPNISDDMLRVSPGSVRILEGQRLQVEVAVANPAVRKAQFRRLMPDGSEVAEAMTALPPGENDEPRFALQCPGASQSFRYRIHAGDALSRYFDVTVVPPPIVKRLEVRYDYPAYTQAPPLVEPDSPGEIKAVAGTVVTVSAVTNKPVQSAELQITGQAVKESPVQIAAGPDGPAVCKFQVKLTPRLRGRWALALKDEDGFGNTTGDRLIEAVPDTPPVVKILAPENKKLRLRATDRLPIAYTMTDDFGLSAADFAIETDSRKRQNVAVTLTPPKGEVLRAAAGEASLNLASLPLAGVRQFTFRLRAADNLPNDLRGPQQGYSETVTVDLDLSAASYAEQALAAEEEAIRKALEKILKELKKSKEDSVPLKELLPKIQAITEDAAKRIDRMRGHLGAAKGTVAELLPRVQEGTFAGLAPKVGSLATEVDGANDKSGQVKLVEATHERGTLAAQTDVHIDRAIEIVLELLKQLSDMADIARLAQSLQDLAERQEDLAAAKAEAELGADQPPASPADATLRSSEPTPPMLLCEAALRCEAREQPLRLRRPDASSLRSTSWQKNESQVSKEVGNLVKEMAAARQAQLAQDQGRAKDLAAKARKLQAEQTALAQDTGKLGQIQQVDNALKNLAAEQAALAREASREKVAADQAKQEDIRRQTEALLAQRNQAAAEIRQSQMSRLEQEQMQVAEEAAQLAQAVAPAGQEPAQLGRQAAGDAQEAANALPSNIGEAAQHATQAGQELGALAQDLNKQVAQQAAAQGQEQAGQEAGGKQAGQEAGAKQGGQEAAGQQAELAQQASALAKHQQELAREMQALARGEPQQALLAEQQAIQAQTQDLAQEAAALAERTQQMAPQLAGAAQQATGALDQAQQAEGQAGQALQSSAPQSATGPQQAAASALGQAASALSSLGQALAQAASGAPAAESPMGTPMANAFSAASQAAQSQTTASAASASQAMSAAASQAMSMAQGMGVHPGMGMMGMQPGLMPSQTANSKKGIGAVGVNLTAAKLESLGIKLSDWARLPGELRNQILQAAEEAGPEEYRTLIKRYFQQIAKRGGAESEGGTP